MFHQNLGKNFKMAAKQAHKGLWVCWPFQGGLQKGSFSGAWYQIQGYRRAFSTCSAHKLSNGVSWSHIGCSSGKQLEHDWRRKYRTWWSWRVPKVRFSFAVFFVCRSLFENRKPYDFSLTSAWYVCIFIPTLCPRLTEKNQCPFRAHSKKRFPLGLYSHLRKEQMHNELQKKLDCDETMQCGLNLTNGEKACRHLPLMSAY